MISRSAQCTLLALLLAVCCFFMPASLYAKAMCRKKAAFRALQKQCINCRIFLPKGSASLLIRDVKATKLIRDTRTTTTTLLQLRWQPHKCRWQVEPSSIAPGFARERGMKSMLKQIQLLQRGKRQFRGHVSELLTQHLFPLPTQTTPRHPSHQVDNRQMADFLRSHYIEKQVKPHDRLPAGMILLPKQTRRLYIIVVLGFSRGLHIWMEGKRTVKVQIKEMASYEGYAFQGTHARGLLQKELELVPLRPARTLRLVSKDAATLRWRRSISLSIEPSSALTPSQPLFGLSLGSDFLFGSYLFRVRLGLRFAPNPTNYPIGDRDRTTFRWMGSAALGLAGVEWKLGRGYALGAVIVEPFIEVALDANRWLVWWGNNSSLYLVFQQYWPLELAIGLTYRLDLPSHRGFGAPAFINRVFFAFQLRR